MALRRAQYVWLGIPPQNSPFHVKHESLRRDIKNPAIKPRHEEITLMETSADLRSSQMLQCPT